MPAPIEQLPSPESNAQRPGACPLPGLRGALRLTRSGAGARCRRSARRSRRSPRCGRGPSCRSVRATRRAKGSFCSTSSTAIPSSFSFMMTSPISCTMLGWMPSLGSSRMSSLGSLASARPMASCCCWPPDRSPPRRPSIFFSTGNSVKILLGQRARRPCAARPDAQVLLDGEVGEDLAPLRHVADAEARALLRASARPALARRT